MAETATDISRLTLAEHQEKKRRHKNMVRPAVDERNLVIGAKFPTQMRRRDDTATTTAKDNDLFSRHNKIIRSENGQADLAVARARLPERSVSARRFFSRRSRHCRCSTLPSAVSSLAKPEPHLSNPMTSLSDKSLSHSMEKYPRHCLV
jgi:hypothetical protein